MKGDELDPAFAGKTRLDALGAEEISNALRSRLDWPLQQALDALVAVSNEAAA